MIGQAVLLPFDLQFFDRSGCAFTFELGFVIGQAVLCDWSGCAFDL